MIRPRPRGSAGGAGIALAAGLVLAAGSVAGALVGCAPAGGGPPDGGRPDGGDRSPWPAPVALGATGLGGPVLVHIPGREMMLVSTVPEAGGAGVEARLFDPMTWRFGPPTRLDDGQGDVPAPVAALSGAGTFARVIVAFPEAAGGSGLPDTVVVRVYPRTGPWAPARVLDRPAPTDVTPAMRGLSLSATGRGPALLAWLHGTTDAAPARGEAATYVPGAGWHRVDLGITGEAVAAVADPGGGGTVLVEGASGLASPLRAVPVSPGGTVGAPVTLDPDTGGEAAAEGVVGTDGATTVVWIRLAASPPRLVYARRPAGGDRWSAPAPVIPRPARPAQGRWPGALGPGARGPAPDGAVPVGGPAPHLLGQVGTVRAAWGRKGNAGDALLVATAFDGHPFLPPARIPLGAARIAGPVTYAADWPGPAVVTAPGPHGVWASLRPADGAFGPAWALFQAPASHVGPVAAAVDDSGDVFLAWSQGAGLPRTLHWAAIPCP